MGGLAKKIPFTCAMMWIGSVALAGFPPFSGFYSKDAILEAAFMSHVPFANMAFYMGITAAFLTAFYSWRLIFLVFHGKSRADAHTFDHVAEPPKAMLFPLLILAIGSVGAGFVGYDIFGMISFENNFFANAIFVQPNNHILDEIHHTPALIKALPMILGVIAIAIAYIFYIAKPQLPALIAKNLKILYKISYNKWYFDEIYNILFVKSLKRMSSKLWKFWDNKIIDGLGPNGVAQGCKFFASKVSKIQSGYMNHYAAAMALGIAAMITYLIAMILY
jgi:NADH-quinone oxidoreductase subunit L